MKQNKTDVAIKNQDSILEKRDHLISNPATVNDVWEVYKYSQSYIEEVELHRGYQTFLLIPY